jgi:hypothetical protein
MLHQQLRSSARAPRPSLAPRRSRGIVVAPAALAAPTATAAAASAEDAARAFAAAVTGEWEGVTATFSPSGDALELPERFVPQAFREWDMVPKDWQSQCSVPPLLEAAAAAGGAEGAAPRHAASSSSPAAAAAAASPPLRYASRRMMPTVGCEADAVAFTEDMAVIGGGGGGAAAAGALLAAVAPDGAYAAAPASLPADGRATVRVESCFPLTDTSDKNGRRERLRVVQTFARDWTVRLPAPADEEEAGGAAAAPSSSPPPPPPASLLRLEGVELHREFLEGPYTARVELLGCGGGAPPISKLERTPAEALGGGARAEAAAAGAPPAPPAAPGAPPGSLASPAGVLTLLPLGAWSYVRRRSGGRGLIAEAGVVGGGGGGGGGGDGDPAPRRRRRRVIAVEFAADGALSSASIADEE